MQVVQSADESWHTCEGMTRLSIGSSPYLAPIGALSAVSNETKFPAGWEGALLGRATGVLLPAFWRLPSDAILMRQADRFDA